MPTVTQSPKLLMKEEAAEERHPSQPQGVCARSQLHLGAQWTECTCLLGSQRAEGRKESCADRGSSGILSLRESSLPCCGALVQWSFSPPHTQSNPGPCHPILTQVKIHPPPEGSENLHAILISLSSINSL